MTARNRIDPRGPRFAAWITSALLLIATVLALTGIAASTSSRGWAISTASLGERVTDPGFVVAAIVAALFIWGVVSPPTSPWAVLFRTAVRPRLTPPVELEDPRPPRFAQGVGLFVVALGLVLHLVGVPLVLPIATAAAFIAAFLNAAFGFCLGCQMYLLLQRAGVLQQSEAPT
ncbi:DUF4395 domain-containing protein [Microbacterium sp. NPDC055521]